MSTTFVGRLFVSGGGLFADLPRYSGSLRAAMADPRDDEHRIAGLLRLDEFSGATLGHTVPVKRPQVATQLGNGLPVCEDRVVVLRRLTIGRWS